VAKNTGATRSIISSVAVSEIRKFLAFLPSRRAAPDSRRRYCALCAKAFGIVIPPGEPETARDRDHRPAVRSWRVWVGASRHWRWGGVVFATVVGTPVIEITARSLSAHAVRWSPAGTGSDVVPVVSRRFTIPPSRTLASSPLPFELRRLLDGQVKLRRRDVRFPRTRWGSISVKVGRAHSL
jgi:hypothetical protein